MPSFINSFQAKVTAAIISAFLVVVGTSNLIIHQFALKAQFEQLREELKVVARTAAVSVSAEDLTAIPLRREGLETPQYQAISATLQRIRRDNPDLAYVYILTRTSREGIWQFIVDADPIQKRRQGITSYPGDKYDATRWPEMLKAWDEASADRKLGRDEWGIMMSGYAPIRDSDGRTVAVLGVDMLAHDVYATQQAVFYRGLMVLLLGIILSVLLGIFLSRRITGPVRELAEATRCISRGDLSHPVEVRGRDEIAELGMSFNEMLRQLSEARKKNTDYFYGVIQSLVMIVEAKDRYTRGHSERVSEYAVKIARRMGFTPDELEMLQQVAVLHDIGKLGIQDAILNKPGKLSPEEWDVVKMHPVTGAEILKPVLFEPQMLAIVRAHHERVDGKGYPDGLTREQTSIFAQILTVADAFDAMTSSRAYRPQPLRTDEALQELLRNKGVQFNPQVVDVFAKILKEETN